MKKLAQYSSLATAFIACNAASAQIVYTNLNPDLLTEEEKLFLDIDNDGIPDLYFEVDSPSTSGWSTSGASVTQVATGWSHITDMWPMVKRLNYDQVISADNGWLPFETEDYFLGNLAWASYTTEGLGTFGNAGGNFLNKTGKFIGIRKFDDGNYYYGWIRLSVELIAYPIAGITAHKFVITVHDYALNTTPDDLIYAGQTGSDCNPPFQLEPISLSPTATTVKWQPVAGAEKYKIKYRKTGVAAWTNILVNAPKSSKKITGLLCDTDYEWKISSSCDGGATYSAFSDIKEFSTADCRAMTDEIHQEISIYPNPASETLIVDLDGIFEATNVEIINMSGEIIHSIQTLENAFLEIDLSQIPAGMYLLKVTGNNTLVTKKFIKQ